MADMLQWEYRTETFGSIWKRTKDDDLMAALNAWGEDGWEVVSATPIEGSYRVLVIAKRPLTRSARRERSWGT